MTEAWAELESDPGLFTLLLKDFGVRDVEVEEVYDLHSPLEGPSYGFIFLFKWLGNTRRSRHGTFGPSAKSSQLVTDEATLNSIFFAKQNVPNSCATYALLNILLNHENVDLGQTLQSLKEETHGLSPEKKGAAVSGSHALCHAHNKHARPDAVRQMKKDMQISNSSQNFAGYSNCFRRQLSTETFHFASYVPIGGHLYELDSLKAYPIDHGIIPEPMEWTQFFQQIILDRFSFLNLENNKEEIRYNLMTLVPCKLKIYRQHLDILTANQGLLWSAAEKMVSLADQRKNGCQSAAPAVRVSTRSMLNADDAHQRVVSYVDGLLADDLETRCEEMSRSDGDESEEISGLKHRSTAEVVFSLKIVDFDVSIGCVSGEDEADCPSRTAGNCVPAPTVKLDFGDPTAPSQPLLLAELARLIKEVEEEMRNVKFIIKDLEYRAKRYEIDDQRRVHDYDPFIRTFLSMLASEKANSA